MADESLSTARSNSQEEGKMGTLTDLLGTGEAATALGGVITALLDKLSHAVGWCANHDTPNRVAINTYIAEIQNSNIDPLIKAARISNAKKIIREYCNQENIVSIAIQSVKSDAKPENIDDDWLAQFMDKARLVSAEEFQLIWGKILANECNHPGCIPRVLLEILSRMDKLDAEVFSFLCSTTIALEDDYAPVIIYDKLEDYNFPKMTFDQLLDLEALGLISTNFDGFSGGFYMSVSKENSRVCYFEKFKSVEKDEKVPVGNIIYTKAGKALYNSIQPERISNFWENFILPYWNSMKNIIESQNE